LIGRNNQMNDKDFCIEYVKRIPRPTRMKMDRQMVQIVEQKIKININEMFNDKGINQLFNENNYMHKFVYCFIRDNQDLF